MSGYKNVKILSFFSQFCVKTMSRQCWISSLYTWLFGMLDDFTLTFAEMTLTHSRDDLDIRRDDLDICRDDLDIHRDELDIRRNDHDIRG